MAIDKAIFTMNVMQRNGNISFYMDIKCEPFYVDVCVNVLNYSFIYPFLSQIFSCAIKFNKETTMKMINFGILFLWQQDHSFAHNDFRKMMIFG